MKLLKIVVEGFRAFSKRQEINLPDAPGLYLVRGDNQVDDSLEGNDVGKSTLLDAVYWGLYGETTRGLRAGNVVSWGGKTAVVEQVWMIGGRLLTVKRQQSPNGLWINGKQLSNGDDRVCEALGMNGAEFLHSVLAGQFSTYFLDLSPADKLGLFSEVLGLDYWERLSKQAGAKSAKREAEVQQLSMQLERSRGKLSVLKLQLVQAQKGYDAWKSADRAQRKAQDKTEDKLRQRVDELHARWDGANTARKKADFESREFDQERVRLLADVNVANASAGALQEDAKRSTCPFCERSLQAGWKGKVKQLCKAAEEKVGDLKIEFRAAVAKCTACDGKVKLLQLETDTLYRKLQEVKQKLAVVESQQAVDVKNPHKERVRDLGRQIEEERTIRSELNLDHEKASESVRRWQYWVKGFRDLRLWVLDSTLAELEMRINNSLVQLGLPRWSVHLAVERENKSGGVTKGFLVDVRSPESGEGAPWKGWGGGVSQRLRVAAEIGLGHLIADRKGVDVEFEVWDEPTSHLSEQGVQDLLLHLQARAQEEKRMIWVVDHRSLDFAFDGGLLVTKTGDGSKITVC